jgi:HAD superfamily hydrolase (TIGR01509 family)
VNYTHIVFDVDGTLLDTEKTGLVSLQWTIRQELGKEMTLEELYPYFGIPSWEAVLQLGFRDPSKAAAIWEHHFQSLVHMAEPFEGIEETLQILHKKGVVMGVVTSRNRAELESDHHMALWMHLFTATICAEDTPAPKPAPDPMLAFLSRTGADRAKVLFVGDTSYDQQCAYAAGTAFAFALWGTRNGKNIPATYYLRHPKDILGL